MDPRVTSALRLGGLVLAVVLVQLAVLTQFRPFGVVPDAVPVLVVSIGLLGGSNLGAAAGFVAGLLIDLMLIQTLGVSSLLLTVEGYAAGRLRELRDPVHPLTTPAVGALATLFFSFGFSVMQFSLGQPAPLILNLFTHAFIAAAFGALLATPVFRMVRAALIPALGERGDPLFRRRRATLAPTRVLEPPSIKRRRRRPPFSSGSGPGGL